MGSSVFLISLTFDDGCCLNQRLLIITRYLVRGHLPLWGCPDFRPSPGSNRSLAWLRTRPGSIVPILGARRLDQVRDNLSCLDVTIPEHLRRLDEASRIDLGFPHEFYADPLRRDRLFGGLYSRWHDIANHEAKSNASKSTG